MPNKKRTRKQVMEDYLFAAEVWLTDLRKWVSDLPDDGTATTEDEGGENPKPPLPPKPPEP